MEKTLSVVQRGRGFIIQFNFIEKNNVLVTESKETFCDRAKANTVAQTWSKMYKAKLQV